MWKMKEVLKKLRYKKEMKAQTQTRARVNQKIFRSQLESLFFDIRFFVPFLHWHFTLKSNRKIESFNAEVYHEFTHCFWTKMYDSLLCILLIYFTSFWIINFRNTPLRTRLDMWQYNFIFLSVMLEKQKSFSQHKAYSHKRDSKYFFNIKKRKNNQILISEQMVWCC